jgi:hypothetical protein
MNFFFVEINLNYVYCSNYIKDPDKLHIVPYDNQISELVVYALDSHHKVVEHRPLDSYVYLIKVRNKNPYNLPPKNKKNLIICSI